MKKIFFILLAVLTIFLFVTSCGEKAGGDNSIIPSVPSNPENPTIDDDQPKTLKERINKAISGDIINLGKEDLEIKDSESYTIDKPITICDGNLKNATFVVKSDGVVFENLCNIENVLAEKEINDGDFEISNCYEVKNFYVRGGGANSIHIAGTFINNLQVAKENVRIVLKEVAGVSAKVENAIISANCILDSEVNNTVDSNSDFGQITIKNTVKSVVLKGLTSVETIFAEISVTEEGENQNAIVSVESPDVKIDATSDNVELTVPEKFDFKVPETEVITENFTIKTILNGNINTYVVYKGFYFFPEDPIVNGFEFLGWYKDISCTEEANFPCIIESDVTLYAKLLPKERFFVIGGGISSSDFYETYYGDDIKTGILNDASVESTAECDIITVNNVSSSSDVWDIWAASFENWNFEANKNYKITVDIKSEKESKILLQVHSRGSSSANSKLISVGSEWQTVEIESGCWNMDWLGHLQVACGRSTKTYLKNVTMTEQSTKRIPTGTWGSDMDSISVDQVENGVKFTFNKETDSWSNGASIRGNFIDVTKNYLYRVNFTAVANAENVKLNYSLHASGDENCWGSTILGKNPKKISLYIPAYQNKDEEYSGTDLVFSVATKNSITVTDISFESLTSIPKDQVIFFTCDYSNYERITGTGIDNSVIINVEPKTTAELRFVMECADNSVISWTNSSSFIRFDNKSNSVVEVPSGKDYPVLINSTDSKKSYRLYIDQSWNIVVEDYQEPEPITFTVNFLTLYEDVGIVKDSVSVIEGEYITLEAPSIPDDVDFDFTFAGWYEGVVKTSNGNYDFTNATLVESSHIVTCDVTLYAKWEEADQTEFFVCDVINKIYDSKYSEIANKVGLSYTAGIVTGLKTTKTTTEFKVENTNVVEKLSSEWDYYIASVQNYTMSANQNYKVSIEAKVDEEQDVIFRMSDYQRDESYYQITKEIGTDWQTVEFETGSWTADWLAQLIVYVGKTNVMYLRNLKVEAVNTKLLPVGEYRKPILTNRTENGFTVEMAESDNWVDILGQKSEFGNLYKIEFDVESTNPTTFGFGAKAVRADYADTLIERENLSGLTSIVAYVPHVGSFRNTDYEFMNLGFNTSCKTTITISNFKVEKVTDNYPNVLLSLGYDNINFYNLTPCTDGSSNAIVILEPLASNTIVAHLNPEGRLSGFDWKNMMETRTAVEVSSGKFSLTEDNDSKPVITNITSETQSYKIWINEKYQIVVEDLD